MLKDMRNIVVGSQRGMSMNDEIRALIIQKTDAATIKKAAVRNGMRTLRGDALDKIFEGITSVEEIMRAINAEEEG